jgi:hypothetical protein
MNEFQFEFDEQEIAIRAVKIVVDTYKGSVPDFSPFPKPLSYDNLLKHNETLGILVSAVNCALRNIVEESFPGNQNIEPIKVPPDALERIAW